MSNVHEHKIRNIYADIANLDDDVKNNIWYVWQGVTEYLMLITPLKLINKAAEIEKGEEAIISELKKWIYSRNYRSNIDVRSLKLSRLLSTSIYFAQS